MPNFIKTIPAIVAAIPKQKINPMGIKIVKKEPPKPLHLNQIKRIIQNKPNNTPRHNVIIPAILILYPLMNKQAILTPQLKQLLNLSLTLYDASNQ